MKLVKLGGSIITDKKVMRRFSQKTAARLASELAKAYEEGTGFVLVNGAGSFGHMLAKKHGLQNGYNNDDQIPVVAEVMKDVRDLNVRLLTALNEAGVPAVSIPPNVTVVQKDKKIYKFDMGAMLRHIELGLVPVTFGDVVPDVNLGFSICSGDQLMLKLACAKELEVTDAIFVTDVDGVFSANPSRDRKAHLIPVLDRKHLEEIESTEASAPDVTGGIREKIWLGTQMAQAGVRTVIVNGSVRGRLRDAMMDKDIICSVIPAVRPRGGTTPE